MSDPVGLYYDTLDTQEWERLEHGIGRIEYACIHRMIRRYLSPTGRLIDIGCGPGRYALDAARAGFHVTLMDMSARQVELAVSRMKCAGIEVESAIEGTACDLSAFSDNIFDAVLCMGPLYHLTEFDERQQVLREIHRILKPGCKAVTTWFGSLGMLRLGIADLSHRYSNLSEIYRFLSPTSFTHKDMQNGFTRCHFTTPEAIKSEVIRSGMCLVSYASAQGFAGGIRRDIEMLEKDHPKAFKNLIETCAEYCEDPRFRDIGQHLVVVIEKPQS